MSKSIKILGTGCPKCKTLEQSVRNIVAEMNIDAEITKVEDIMDIMQYGIMRTPGLVVDGKVVMSGRLPSVDELKSMLS
ncbi:MAG: TM0996/MTH895 family glutaredoxin-like protein [Bacteroidetes bacterium]|jgi:small redox-active disulfide protein 2|nr:TM0996/MTH895 family glutaredoxin-like protein [Bacteroidota bacterium]